MEFPSGHHSHTRHQRRENEDEERRPPPPQPSHFGFNEPPPPPSHFGFNEPPPPHHRFDEPPPPPPPQVSHVYHSSHTHIGGPGEGADYYSRPPPPSQDLNFSGSHGYDYPPPTTTVHHVSHESPLPTKTHHHHSQEASGLAVKPAVRVFTKAQTNFSLTIRDGKVILAPSDPSDRLQHWIKDEKYSTRVKDEEGFPSFALVNKATGQAMKHSIGATQPVQLIPYNPDVLDESILWTESKDLGDTYRTIRMVNNIRLNVDAFHGDKNHGGVYDGTTIVLWEWKKGDNQRWKIIPH